MTDDTGMLEKITIDEIGGKNAAIHAYDAILWKIRAGYLTLLFGSSTALLTFLEGTAVTGAVFLPFAIALFFVSIGLTIGGFSIDRNYVPCG